MLLAPGLPDGYCALTCGRCSCALPSPAAAIAAPSTGAPHAANSAKVWQPSLFQARRRTAEYSQRSHQHAGFAEAEQNTLAQLNLSSAVASGSLVTQDLARLTLHARVTLRLPRRAAEG